MRLSFCLKMDDEKLIELVRGKEFLYNKSHRDYKKNDKREKAWEEFGKELCVESDIVKKRWKSIKDRYIRLKQKENKPSGSGAGEKLKNYKFYEMLSFLNDCNNIKKRTHCSFDESAIFTDNESSFNASIQQFNFEECEDSLTEEMHCDIDPYVDSTEASSSADTGRNSSSASSSNERSTSRATLSRCSKRSLVDDVLIRNSNEEILKLMRSMKSDYDRSATKEAVFCDSLRVQLEEAKLPVSQFLDFQRQVFQLLRDKMGH